MHRLVKVYGYVDIVGGAVVDGVVVVIGARILCGRDAMAGNCADYLITFLTRPLLSAAIAVYFMTRVCSKRFLYLYTPVHIPIYSLFFFFLLFPRKTRMLHFFSLFFLIP